MTKGHYRSQPTTRTTTDSTTQHPALHFTTPTAITEQLHIIEHQTATALRLNDHTHYAQLFTALTLEEYRLSLQQTTPLDRLDYSRPLQCIPGDLRKPHYDSTLLSITMAAACNVHCYHTTSFHTTTGHPDHYVVVKLHIVQELLLRYLISGQLLHFTWDYISYMPSTQTPHYLPHRQGGLRHEQVHQDLQSEEQLHLELPHALAST